MQQNYWMQQAIEQAKQASWHVHPNPAVGAVIVHNEQIIAKGYHKKWGTVHAEVNAIASVKDPSLLKESTLYVTLEPCNHQGKTPPCSQAIVEAGISSIVIGALDPNPMTCGQGLKTLQEAGCKVECGILKKDCIDLNLAFYTQHLLKRPYITLKWAETADGFIAREDFSSKWISSKSARDYVHQLRSFHSSILVGTQTALIDNPELTSRIKDGRNPVRIIIDRELVVPKTHKIYDRSVKSIILNSCANKAEENLLFLKSEFQIKSASNILSALSAENLQSIFIEGGSKTLQTFIDEGLWDQVYIFKSPEKFGSGIKAPDIKYPLPAEFREFDGTKMYHLNRTQQLCVEPTS